MQGAISLQKFLQAVGYRVCDDHYLILYRESFRRRMSPQYGSGMQNVYDFNVCGNVVEVTFLMGRQLSVRQSSNCHNQLRFAKRYEFLDARSALSE